MRARALRVAAGALLALCAVGMVLGPASATSLRVADSAEAWYNTVLPSSVKAPSVCSLLPTCPVDVPSLLSKLTLSSYPKGTLHVGVRGGRTVAQAYVVPDLSTVPLKSKLVSAVMTLPVTQAPHSGNANVPEADLVACPATGKVADEVYGGLTGAPSFDCTHARSPAKYDDETHSFTIDLAPLLTKWSPGLPAPDIALVPAPDTEKTATWHVSLNGTHAPGHPVIETALRSEQIGSAGPSRTPGGTPDSTHAGANPVGGPGVSSPEAGPKLPDSAPVGASTDKAAESHRPASKATTPKAGPPAEQSAPVALVSSEWYRARTVALLPLALIAALVLSGNTLTRAQVLRSRR